jgi:hypothetical protein
MRCTRAIPLAALFAVLASQSALAATSSGHTQFRWLDGAGTPHYSDTLTADALKYGYDVLNAKGAVVKHIDRQRTIEELLAAEAEANAAAEAKRQAEVEAISEKRLLDAYPTEHDFMVARQAQLDSIDHNIKSASNSLGIQERGLSDMLAQAASYEHAKSAPPDTLKKQIEAQRKNVDQLRAYIARRQKEKTEATQRMETDLARYRDAFSRKSERIQ